MQGGRPEGRPTRSEPKASEVPVDWQATRRATALALAGDSARHRARSGWLFGTPARSLGAPRRCALREPAPRLRGRLGLAEQEALELVAAQLREQLGLLFGLDALGDHRAAEH